MAGYIGSRASVVSSGAERKKTFDITGTTTVLTGLSYTPTFVHLFHNGVRLVDGTDYTATNGTSITLTTAAESGDQVVVVSYATFQAADAYTKAEADAEFVSVSGDTMTGNLDVTGDVSVTGNLTAGNLNLNTYSSGAVNDRVALGVAVSTTTCFFLLPISGFVPPTGITVTGTFNITTLGGSLVTGGFGITPVDGGGSSNKMQHIQVSGLTVTAGNNYYLRATDATSVIEVNY